MGDFRALVVWQKSYAFGQRVTDLLDSFPQVEQYGLAMQLRRGAVSVPSNIAEGARRGTNGEFIHFLGIARGSLGELESQLQFARDRRSISHDQWSQLDREAQEIGRMLSRLMSYLRLKKSTARKPRASR